MIVGNMAPNGDAVASLELEGPRKQAFRVLAVVDTGFNGHLALSPEQIRRLQLTSSRETRYVLADGNEAVSRVFIAKARWHGAWRRVSIIELDGGALVGMSMFRGSILSIEVTDGGKVSVHPLPTQ